MRVPVRHVWVQRRRSYTYMTWVSGDGVRWGKRVDGRRSLLDTWNYLLNKMRPCLLVRRCQLSVGPPRRRRRGHSMTASARAPSERGGAADAEGGASSFRRASLLPHLPRPVRSPTATPSPWPNKSSSKVYKSSSKVSTRPRRRRTRSDHGLNLRDAPRPPSPAGAQARAERCDAVVLNVASTAATVSGRSARSFGPRAAGVPI